MIAEKIPTMEKAIVRLRNLSEDEKAKQLEEERISGIALRKTLENTARREGKIEGKIETTLKMLKKGFDYKEISELLDMPTDWVMKIETEER